MAHTALYLSYKYLFTFRVFFCITIMLTYPIECFVCREVFENIFLGKENSDVELSTKNHVAITVALVGLNYLCSLITDCLSIVMQINVKHATYFFRHLAPFFRLLQFALHI